jgi:hypothetical protein
MTDDRPEPTAWGCLLVVGALPAVARYSLTRDVVIDPSIYVRGPEIFVVWVTGIILGALGVVLNTLATRAIIRARRRTRGG